MLGITGQNCRQYHSTNDRRSHPLCRYDADIGYCACNFGVETTSIIAVLGAAGLAIGLALQGTLSNVAAGLMLVFLRPFKVGDWIEAASVSGTVREIGLFSTIIDTFDNVFISVPNSSIWSSNIINYSRYERRRLDIDIGIDIDSDLAVAETAMMKLADDPRVLPDPAPRFIVVNYTDFAMTVRCCAFMLPMPTWLILAMI